MEEYTIFKAVADKAQPKVGQLYVDNDGDLIVYVDDSPEAEYPWIEIGAYSIKEHTAGWPVSPLTEVPWKDLYGKLHR